MCASVCAAEWFVGCRAWGMCCGAAGWRSGRVSLGCSYACAHAKRRARKVPPRTQSHTQCRHVPKFVCFVFLCAASQFARATKQNVDPGRQEDTHATSCPRLSCRRRRSSIRLKAVEAGTEPGKSFKKERPRKLFSAFPDPTDQRIRIRITGAVCKPQSPRGAASVSSIMRALRVQHWHWALMLHTCRP